MDAWLKLAQWLVSQFGVPGASLGALALILGYLLKLKEEELKSTRDKMDAINEKRVELHSMYLQALGKLDTSIQAVTATLSKIK